MASKVTSHTFYSAYGIFLPDYPFVQEIDGRPFCKICGVMIAIQKGQELTSLIAHSGTDYHKDKFHRRHRFTKTNMFGGRRRRTNSSNKERYGRTVQSKSNNISC